MEQCSETSAGVSRPEVRWSRSSLADASSSFFGTFASSFSSRM